MIDINELRDRAATFGSDYLTDEEWVEVIDRLEVAEKAVTEAYQRGYATGQEEIVAELEFAKREVANLHDDISEWMDKCDALRAKIAEMEKQEPVASVWRCDNGHIHGSCERTLPMGAKLYALPGAQAQPAPSVPEVQSQSHEVLGQTCIDGGKCHHHCNQRLDKRCFRRECCEPFSDYCGPWAYDDGPPKPKLEAKP